MRETADFDAFYASTSRRVVDQVFMMTGSRAEAEDAVAEAYARAWQQWAKVSVHPAPEAWVRTTACRISVSTWRKATNRLLAHRRHGQAGDVPGLSPDHIALMDALGRIPADQRRAIVLHYYVGMPVEEISQETDCPVNTVKTPPGPRPQGPGRQGLRVRRRIRQHLNVGGAQQCLTFS